MNGTMEPSPASDLIFYQPEDGKTRMQYRFEGENIWLTQAQIAELYQKDVKTINEHLSTSMMTLISTRIQPSGNSGWFDSRENVR